MNQAHEKKDNEAMTPRRRYSTPALVEYGPVSKLTQGGASSTTSDAGNNMMMPTCL
jgi:hypothetical protein